MIMKRRMRQLRELAPWTNHVHHVKQTRVMQDGPVVFFNIHNHFVDPDHIAKQAAEAEGKMKNSDYDGERKIWYWDNYFALHKEPQAIMESLTDYS